jgi:hypothetical protein
LRIVRATAATGGFEFVTPDSPWVTRSEAAEYLRWSVDTIDKNLIKLDDNKKPVKGKMRYRLMENRWVRIVRSDVYAMCPEPEEVR